MKPWARDHVARVRDGELGALRPHTWSRVREVCLACGRTAVEIAEADIVGCDGTLQYREWLKDGVWVREPIVPRDDDERLPADVWLGNTVFRKGVKVSVLRAAIARMEARHA